MQVDISTAIATGSAVAAVAASWANTRTHLHHVHTTAKEAAAEAHTTALDMSAVKEHLKMLPCANCSSQW